MDLNGILLLLQVPHFTEPQVIEKLHAVRSAGSGGRGPLQSVGDDMGYQPSHLVAVGFWTNFLTWNSYISLICKKKHKDTDCRNSCNSSFLLVVHALCNVILQLPLPPTPLRGRLSSSKLCIRPGLTCSGQQKAVGMTAVYQFGAWAQKVLDASAFSFRIQLSPSPCSWLEDEAP